MDLYTSGVKLPRLGSVQDRVLRQHLFRKAHKETTLQKILVTAALSNLAKEGQDSLINAWSSYINMCYYAEGTEIEKEQDMQKEFAFWKTVKPKVLKDKDGKVKITGLPSEMLPKVKFSKSSPDP